MEPKNYRTFKRTCTDWESYSKARKIEDMSNLTYSEAARRAERLNESLTPAQKRRGTRYEFESV
jgi:hypothetical protein